MKEFNLSKRRMIRYEQEDAEGYCYMEEDVKEFIRRLKLFEWTSVYIEENKQTMIDVYQVDKFFRDLDKLAGEELK